MACSTGTSGGIPCVHLHRACLCYCCAWRRVHSRFWASLSSSVAQPVHNCAMGDSDSGDNVYGDCVPLLTGGGGAAAFHEHTDSPVVVQGTQDTLNVSIPDSFVAAPRFLLPQPPHASMPPGKRAAHDRLKPSWATLLPNVHRCYDENSRAIAHVAWEFVMPLEVWAIVTSQLLGAGRLGSMAWFKNTAVGHVHELLKKFVQMANDDDVTHKVPISSLQRVFWYSHTFTCSGRYTLPRSPLNGLNSNSLTHVRHLVFCSLSGRNSQRTTKRIRSRFFLDSSLMQQPSRLILVASLL
jgi:hypothetical protein